MDPKPSTSSAPEASNAEGVSCEEGAVGPVESVAGFTIEGIYIPPPAQPQPTATKGDGSRLVLRKIVNESFKSYGGSCIVGPLHKNFNAVIGPNSCGKSNVLDSLLFAFGRDDGLNLTIPQLIHKSRKYHDLESCMVELHFARIIEGEDNSFQVVPGSEFTMSRMTDIDNTSYYKLNEENVQFEELALFLKEQGIDLYNQRFIILQGEIERISQMASKAIRPQEVGLLEYLDEAIGTSRYKQPLQQLASKHRAFGDQRFIKLARLKYLDMELERMREMMEEATAYLQIENDITTAENILLQAEMLNLKSHIEKLNLEKQSIKVQLDGIVDHLTNVQAEMEDKTNRYNNIQSEYNALIQTRRNCRNTLNIIDGQSVQVEVEIEEIGKYQKNTEKKLEDEQKNKMELTELPEKAKKCLKELELKEAELEAQHEQLEEERLRIFDSLQYCTKELVEQRCVLEDELVQLSDNAAKANSVVKIAEAKLALYMDAPNRAQKDLEELEGAHASVVERAAAARADVERLTREIAEAEARLPRATDEAALLDGRRPGLLARQRTCALRFADARSEAEAEQMGPRVLAALERQHRAGNLPGFMGTLSGVGHIVRASELPLPMPESLDHIAVDTIDTATWCLEFLKKYNIGRASFIALEFLKNTTDIEINMPPDLPRSYEQVPVDDERVRAALQAGVARANGDGRGAAAAPTELERLEQAFRAAGDEIDENRRQSNDLAKEIAELQRRIPELNHQLQLRVVTEESLNIQEPQLARQLSNQRQYMKEIQVDERIIQKLKQEIAEGKVVYDNAEKAAHTFQLGVNAVKKEIEEKTTEKILAVEKEIKEAYQSLCNIRDEKVKYKVSICTATRNLEKCIDRIEVIKKYVEESEDDLKNLKAKQEELIIEKQDMMSEFEGFTKELELKDEMLTKLKAELTTLKKQEYTIKISKIHVDAAMCLVTKDIDQLETSLLLHQEKLSKLKYHETPDRQKPELKTYSKDELATKNLRLIENEIARAKEALRRQHPNFASLEECKRNRDNYAMLSDAVNTISERRNKVGFVFNNLKARRKVEYLSGLNIIRRKLRETYEMLSLGGNANIELINNNDPFSEGVVLIAQPSKRCWKPMAHLSGGEKCIASIALVFALHDYKPSALYLLDDIDAGLDYRNTTIVGHYIKERSKNAQFIVVSLKPNIFELAQYLVGVHKLQECTASATLDITWHPSLRNLIAGIGEESENVTGEVPSAGESMEIDPDVNAEASSSNEPATGEENVEAGSSNEPATEEENVEAGSSNEPATEEENVEATFSESQQE